MKTSFVLVFFFLLHGAACWIPVLLTVIKPMTPEVEARSPNHWTAREVPKTVEFKNAQSITMVPGSFEALRLNVTEKTRFGACEERSTRSQQV